MRLSLPCMKSDHQFVATQTNQRLIIFVFQTILLYNRNTCTFKVMYVLYMCVCICGCMCVCVYHIRTYVKLSSRLLYLYRFLACYLYYYQAVLKGASSWVLSWYKSFNQVPFTHNWVRYPL